MPTLVQIQLDPNLTIEKKLIIYYVKNFDNIIKIILYIYIYGRLRLLKIDLCNGIVVQLVRVPPCQDGSCGFEPRQSRL